MRAGGREAAHQLLQQAQYPPCGAARAVPAAAAAARPSGVPDGDGQGRRERRAAGRAVLAPAPRAGGRSGADRTTACTGRAQQLLPIPGLHRGLASSTTPRRWTGTPTKVGLDTRSAPDVGVTASPTSGSPLPLTTDIPRPPALEHFRPHLGRGRRGERR